MILNYINPKKLFKYLFGNNYPIKVGDYAFDTYLVTDIYFDWGNGLWMAEIDTLKQK